MLRQARLLIRDILGNRLYTFLNILGLSVALLSVALICMWVIHESGYDKFNANYHRIYQINNLSVKDGMRWDSTPSPFAPEIKNNCPGVEQITRKGISSDPEIFDIFSLNPVAGDAREALRIENTMVVTESFAKRYFGIMR